VSSNELEAKSIFDELNGVYGTLYELEFDLAKQNPLSDRIHELRQQESEFASLRQSVSQKTGAINQCLLKCNEFCSAEENKSVKLHDDLIKFEHECANKLKLVIINVV
jgi:hypothetical protein